MTHSLSPEQLIFGFVQRPTPARRTRMRPARLNQEQRRGRRSDPIDPHQGRLPLERSIDEAARLRLERRISAHLRGELSLTVTDNRYSIISIKRGRGHYEARLHHMFVDAEPAIIRALARFISRNDARASAIINEHIDRNQHRIRHSLPPGPRRVTLRPQGRYFDLEEIFDRLNERYFDGRIEACITWGRRRRGRPKRHRSVKMGSYSVDDRLIRIHPSLDRDFVPLFFLESVVFHEMLHQIHEIPCINGRHHYHTASFQAHERTFEQYQTARLWERDNLHKLLHF